MTRHVFPLLAVLLAGACQNQNAPAGQGSWATTTKPFDATCSHCQEVGTGEIAHASGARVMIDTQTDDPAAQWGRCMFGFLRCTDGGGEIAACVDQAECPQACKEAFHSSISGSGFEAEAAAVDQVFFNSGGPCTAPSSSQPGVSP